MSNPLDPFRSKQYVSDQIRLSQNQESLTKKAFEFNNYVEIDNGLATLLQELRTGQPVLVRLIAEDEYFSEASLAEYLQSKLDGKVNAVQFSRLELEYI